MEKIEKALITLARCIDVLENHPKQLQKDFRSRETLIKEILENEK